MAEKHPSLLLEKYRAEINKVQSWKEEMAATKTDYLKAC